MILMTCMWMRSSCQTVYSLFWFLLYHVFIHWFESWLRWSSSQAGDRRVVGLYCLSLLFQAFVILLVSFMISFANASIYIFHVEVLIFACIIGNLIWSRIIHCVPVSPPVSRLISLISGWSSIDCEIESKKGRYSERWYHVSLHGYVSAFR